MHYYLTSYYDLYVLDTGITQQCIHLRYCVGYVQAMCATNLPLGCPVETSDQPSFTLAYMGCHPFGGTWGRSNRALGSTHPPAMFTSPSGQSPGHGCPHFTLTLCTPIVGEWFRLDTPFYHIGNSLCCFMRPICMCC